MDNLTIRQETLRDEEAISRVNDLAFKRSNEAILVLKLRKLEEFDSRLSLVAEYGNQIIGHILLYPVKIKSGEKMIPVLSLGPIAVNPEHQRKGVGGRLIDSAHAAALKLNHEVIILLGHPSYYPRFGYRRAILYGLSNPWGIDNEVFMAIELVEGALKDKSGEVIYPEAFNEAT
jgi:predicted N-acetyltransferase YhbS